MGIIYSNCTKIRAAAIKGALDKINLDPNLIDEVFMGNVVQAGVGQAPARQAALYAGLSILLLVPNKVCASGMKAVMRKAIQCGDAEIVVAGGMENMSMIPHYLNLRNGTKFGPTMIDGMQKMVLLMLTITALWEYVLTYVQQNITLVVKIKITSQFNRMSAVQKMGIE
jgi:acetyl-CoA C-acetyltransferase